MSHPLKQGDRPVRDVMCITFVRLDFDHETRYTRARALIILPKYILRTSKRCRAFLRGRALAPYAGIPLRPIMPQFGLLACPKYVTLRDVIQITGPDAPIMPTGWYDSRMMNPADAIAAICDADFRAKNSKIALRASLIDIHTLDLVYAEMELLDD